MPQNLRTIDKTRKDIHHKKLNCLFPAFYISTICTWIIFEAYNNWLGIYFGHLQHEILGSVIIFLKVSLTFFKGSSLMIFYLHVSIMSFGVLWLLRITKTAKNYLFNLYKLFRIKGSCRFLCILTLAFLIFLAHAESSNPVEHSLTLE